MSGDSSRKPSGSSTHSGTHSPPSTSAVEKTALKSCVKPVRDGGGSNAGWQVLGSTTPSSKRNVSMSSLAGVGGGEMQSNVGEVWHTSRSASGTWDDNALKKDFSSLKLQSQLNLCQPRQQQLHVGSFPPSRVDNRPSGSKNPHINIGQDPHPPRYSASTKSLGPGTYPAPHPSFPLPGLGYDSGVAETFCCRCMAWVEDDLAALHGRQQVQSSMQVPAQVSNSQMWALPPQYVSTNRIQPARDSFVDYPYFGYGNPDPSLLQFGHEIPVEFLFPSPAHDVPPATLALAYVALAALGWLADADDGNEAGTAQLTRTLAPGARVGALVHALARLLCLILLRLCVRVRKISIGIGSNFAKTRDVQRCRRFHNSSLVGDVLQFAPAPQPGAPGAGASTSAGVDEVGLDINARPEEFMRIDVRAKGAKGMTRGDGHAAVARRLGSHISGATQTHTNLRRVLKESKRTQGVEKGYLKLVKGGRPGCRFRTDFAYSLLIYAFALSILSQPQPDVAAPARVAAVKHEFALCICLWGCLDGDTYGFRSAHKAQMHQVGQRDTITSGSVVPFINEIMRTSMFTENGHLASTRTKIASISIYGKGE
ncbi:hypothetical protein B0H11DRAFT_1942036 [Mycena galericulata]|nr:hypothetical protein B0H11DRAFT_1942036 [Mycena galericulata]